MHPLEYASVKEAVHTAGIPEMCNTLSTGEYSTRDLQSVLHGQL